MYGLLTHVTILRPGTSIETKNYIFKVETAITYQHATEQGHTHRRWSALALLNKMSKDLQPKTVLIFRNCLQRICKETSALVISVARHILVGNQKGLSKVNFPKV